MAEMLDVFRALADPTRMRIMHLLAAMELSVGEIAQVMAQSQPRISRHLKILAEARLLQRRKEGNWVFLRVDGNPRSAAIAALLDTVPETDSEALWRKADLARLAAVRADRMRAADAYFAEHAEEWDAIRSLHVPEDEVETAMRRLVGSGDLGRMLDIGTGTGRMIELFGPAAREVKAVDRSVDMLRMARSKLPTEGAGKFDLILGDFCDLPLADASVDLITAHQVLHYAPDPVRVIAEGARVLAPDGRMVIVDFAPHDREELRARDQHERLGFSDLQIAGWFSAAGLALEEQTSLAGGALTVKIWVGRRKTDNIMHIRDKTA